MKTLPFLTRVILSTLPLLFTASLNASVLIDSFVTPQSAPGGTDTRNVADGSGILGGERDFSTFLVFSANGTVPNQMQIAYPEGQLTGRAGGDITYDGPDHDPSSSYFGGMGSIDLTQGGVNDRFRFDISSIANGADILMQIQVRRPFYGSSLWVNLPQNSGFFDVPFAAFQYDGSPFSGPADFHNIGDINFHFEMSSGDAVVMHSIITTVPEPASLALISCLALLIQPAFGPHPRFVRRRKLS